jgi:hypothetical protein
MTSFAIKLGIDPCTNAKGSGCIFGGLVFAYGVARWLHRQNIPLEAYIPLSIGEHGKEYSQNDGHLFVIGKLEPRGVVTTRNLFSVSP